MLILSGNEHKVRTQLSALRMELGNRLGLRKGDVFAPLWVVDFPLLEFDEESGRYHAMHHPFTSPKPEDIHLLETDPGKARANAYDMVLNGNEIGGGSIRIFDRDLQSRMFDLLGFSKEEAEAQFGFLMNANAVSTFLVRCVRCALSCVIVAVLHLLYVFFFFCDLWRSCYHA